MKTTLLIALFGLTCSFSLLNSNNPGFANKSYTFDSTMVIHLFHGGGMRYESTNIYIRYDSCIHVDMEQGVDHITKFAMTQAMREKITQILEKNHAREIQRDEKSYFAHDKATTSICCEINKKLDFCPSESASGEIKEKYRADFSNLWSELESFALNKGKDKN